MRAITVEGIDLPHGWKLAAIKPYSLVGDVHLSVILCFNGEKFATWAYNWESKGCNHGHYTSDVVVAIEDYKERGRF